MWPSATTQAPVNVATSIKQRLAGRRRNRFEDFVALQDVTFDVKEGEVFGVIGQNGSGGATLTLSGIELDSGQNPLLDADGAALVIHAKADDYRTDPSGNSGDRVACAVLGGAKPS